MGAISDTTAGNAKVEFNGDNANNDFVEVWQDTFADTNGSEVFEFTDMDNIKMDSTGDVLEIVVVAEVAGVAGGALGAAGEDEESKGDTKELNEDRSFSETIVAIMKYDIFEEMNDKVETFLFGDTISNLSADTEDGEKGNIFNLIDDIRSFDIFEEINDKVETFIFGDTLDNINREDTTVIKEYNEDTGRMEVSYERDESENGFAHLIHDIINFDIWDTMNEPFEEAFLGDTIDGIQADYNATMREIEKQNAKKDGSDD